MRFLLLSAVAVLKTLLCKGISLVLLTGWFVRENRAHSAASGTVPARVMLRNMQRACVDLRYRGPAVLCGELSPAPAAPVPPQLLLERCALCWRRCCHLLAVEKGRGKPEADAPAAPGRTGPPHCIGRGFRDNKKREAWIGFPFFIAYD